MGKLPSFDDYNPNKLCFRGEVNNFFFVFPLVSRSNSRAHRFFERKRDSGRTRSHKVRQSAESVSNSSCLHPPRWFSSRSLWIEPGPTLSKTLSLFTEPIWCVNFLRSGNGPNKAHKRPALEPLK